SPFRGRVVKVMHSMPGARCSAPCFRSPSVDGAPSMTASSPILRKRNTEAREWFLRQQEKMLADLREVRTVHDHPTAKGDGTELHGLAMLQRRLPARYRAERAFVIDADGNRSQQIDIVIHDRQF